MQPRSATNDLLRPPGTLNHKSAARGGGPTPVEPVLPHTVVKVDPSTLAKLLGVDITNTDGRKNGQSSAAGGSSSQQAEPVDLDAYPQVGEELGKVHVPADRSKDTYRIVAACIDAGLTLAQTRWVIGQRPDLASRLGDRNDDDVLRTWEKVHDERFQEVQNLGKTAGNSQAKTGAGGKTKPEKANGGRGSRAGTSRGDDGRQRLDDAHIGAYIADHYLSGRFLITKGLGWMEFDGRRWRSVAEPVVGEAVRLGILDLYSAEAKTGANAERLKKISGLFYASRIFAILRIAKGYLWIEDANFDTHPDLLNVQNGVVDLRDGSLRLHDPALRLTKLCPHDYLPDAVHEDWQQALRALPDDDVVDWLQLRLGQGLTGYPTPDDVLVFLKGAGRMARPRSWTPSASLWATTTR